MIAIKRGFNYGYSHSKKRKQKVCRYKALFPRARSYFDFAAVKYSILNYKKENNINNVNL